MYKVRTTYKDHDLVTETFNNLSEAINAAKEECMYEETDYSWVYDENEKIVHKSEGWL
jgi:hypothetical protein